MHQIEIDYLDDDVGTWTKVLNYVFLYKKLEKNCFIHGTDIHCCIQNQHLWSIFTLFKGGIFDVVQKIITIYYYETIVINLIIDIKIVEE